MNFVRDFCDSINPFRSNSVTFDYPMKHYRSILSATFAFLVLFSSTSFMVGVHFCGGQIQNIALFTRADGCEMEKRIPPCHKHQSKACCEDETIVHQGENFKVSATEIMLSPVPALEIELPLVPISEVIPSAFVSGARFYNYSPPFRAADRTVSFRAFLI